MAGEIQLNSVSLATKSGGLISFGTSVQPIFAAISNYYLASQQLTGGSDVAAGFYSGSSTIEKRRTINIPAMQLLESMTTERDSEAVFGAISIPQDSFVTPTGTYRNLSYTITEVL